MSARTMRIKASTRACNLNKRDKVPCEPNPIGRDGNRGASLDITEEDRRREPHKFLYKTTKQRHHELERRIDRKKNIQEPITIKDFVTFQDSSWRTLQQKLQQGVPAKSATHTQGTIGGELVFYISKGIITQNRTTAGVSKSLGDAQLGCQTYDYNNVTNRVLNTVASIQDDATWNRLFALSAQGILNTNRLNMSKDRCINIDQGSFEDGTIIKAHTTAFAPIGSSTCIPPYDPCKTATNSCTVTGWTAWLGDPSINPRPRTFIFVEQSGTPCCPGLACEGVGAKVVGAVVEDGGELKWDNTYDGHGEDYPMVTHINGVQCYQIGLNDADGLARSNTEQPNGWCWWNSTENVWYFRYPNEPTLGDLAGTIVKGGDTYNKNILTGNLGEGICGGDDAVAEEDLTTTYLDVVGHSYPEVVFGLEVGKALTNTVQQVNTEFTDALGVTIIVGETVTILFKVSDTEISIQKESGETLNPVDGTFVNNSGVPE